MWRGETPTEPLQIIDVLRHTPYRAARVQRAAADEDDVRAALDLALRVGELMLRCGAGAPQVEGSVVAVAASAGLEAVEVDITNQSLLLQCMTGTGQPVTMLRVVRSSRRDFARLVAVHEFVDALVAGGYDRESAVQRLREIRRARRVWPRWMVSLSFGLLAAAVALMLGAGIVASLMAVATSLIVDATSRWLGRRDLPDFYMNAAGAFVATLFAWGVFCLGALHVLPVTASDFAFIVAGGIVALLPGRAMTSAVEDVISGYPVTGAGRMLAVFLSTAGAIVGVGSGLQVTLALTTHLRLDIASPEILQLRAGTGPLPSALIGACIIGLAASVGAQNRRRMVAPAGLLSLLALGTSYLLVSGPGFGGIASVGVAAVVLGFLGRLLALRMGAPSMVLVVPASSGLLPGLTIFRGLYEMVEQSGTNAGSLSVQTGITTLLGALAVLLAIATGTTLGEYLAAPFDHRVVKARRRRRR